MREERNWKSKLNFIILLPLFMAVAVLPAIKAEAVAAGDDKSIGVYTDFTGGESTTGVRISKNGQTIFYALDTWRKTGEDNWVYTGSNVDGSVQEVVSCANSPVYIKGTSGTRFGINIGKTREYLPERGSVVIKKYVYGKCTYNKAEYTYQNTTSNPVDISESLLKQLENGTSNLDLVSTKYGYDGVSYIYDIYDAAVISRNGDIVADIPADCMVLSEGYAYYGMEEGYIVKELPQIEHDPVPGCTFNFKGWYTRPSGGNEVHIGDVIEKGITIYPQWIMEINSYNVNCIDILGDNPDGQVIGTTSITADYNTVISGSVLGSDETAGVYYKGFCYTGCTSETVQGDCNVYRYFRPVSYNIIFNGNLAAAGETTSMYGCLYGEKYTLAKNGYERNGMVTLDLNAEDAVCATKNINVKYDFTGWSETASGKAIYADCEEVSNLCITDGEKELYAAWEGGGIEINAVPLREGYSFNGWSRDKESMEGSTWFNVSDGNNCILYAVWKPLKAGYSVIYYIKNDKGGYTIDQKKEYSSYTGYEADCSTDLYLEKYYSGYILDKDKSIYRGIVKHDGSLVLECYLKKKPTDTGNAGGTESKPDGKPEEKPEEKPEDNINTDGSGIVTTGGSITGGSSSTGGNGNGWSSGGGGSASGSTGGGLSAGGSNGGEGSVSISQGGSSGSKEEDNSESAAIKKDNTGINTSGGSISGSVSGGGGFNDTNNNITEDADGNKINKENNKNGKKKNNKTSARNKKAIYPKTGKKYTKAGITYKILKSSSKVRTAKAVKAKKGIIKAGIPDFIKIKGYKYKVVSIARSAFAKCHKLKKAVIGKNIKSIGSKAFYKSKGLGNIKIKSKKLKSIGSSAFKSIKPGCVVKIAGNRKYASKVFSMISVND
ncbi:MAG: leucine-rich repeat protein [Lachnospiraceae bacterium]|nr:leucine-rich repeat protein [Lachnospiraceae bacterium]